MGWIHTLFDAHAEGKGTVAEAFRYSTKTTTLTKTIVAFYIGHHPQTSNMIIQVNEAKAQKNAAGIADIIENNNAWKLFFPHVISDSGKAWGAMGYEVMRSNMPYDAWRRLNSGRLDPSFIGLGRTSGSIIGSHPSGVLVIDDIDDENTTSSEREMAKTHVLLTGTIFLKTFLGTAVL